MSRRRDRSSTSSEGSFSDEEARESPPPPPPPPTTTASRRPRASAMSPSGRRAVKASRIRVAASSTSHGPRTTITSSTASKPSRNRNRLSDFDQLDHELLESTSRRHHEESPESPSESLSDEARPARSRNRHVSFDTTTSSSGAARSRQVNVSSSSAGARTGSSSATFVSRRQAIDGSQLSWLERLMPECLLNMTAPITGYERSLEEWPEAANDEELEFLERQRLRRNRRIRRRLVGLMLLATLASAAFYMRGKLFRKVGPNGVRAALGEVKHRIGDGISKTLHDTMGH